MIYCQYSLSFSIPAGDPKGGQIGLRISCMSDCLGNEWKTTEKQGENKIADYEFSFGLAEFELP